MCLPVMRFLAPSPGTCVLTYTRDRTPVIPAGVVPQELAVPAILDKKDVVLAAETGSGKTLAYVAPLIQLVLANRAAARAAHAARQGSPAEAGWHRQHHHTAALVLCPSVMLCEQVRGERLTTQLVPAGTWSLGHLCTGFCCRWFEGCLAFR